jgi:hypothetical protein
MMDFHNYRWCSTNEHFEVQVEGSHGNTYNVLYGKTPNGQYVYGWSCTCKGYQYHGHCKHIEEAKKLRCAFGEGAVVGSPEEMGDKCPNCGSSTSVVRVAV